jgi:LacI family transcriptional regulator
VRLTSLQPFTILWIDGLREHLAEENFRLEIQEHPACYSGRPDRALEALALRLNPAAWVLSQSTARMQHWFAGRAVPCVITGSRHEGVALPSVDRDYRAIGRHAAGKILARGYNRLAFLNPDPILAGDRESEEGFKEGVLKHQRRDVSCVIAHHNGTVADICARLDGVLKHSPAATAFLVSRPDHVLTVMSRLLGGGLRLPKDAALISRDDDTFLGSLVPSVARYATNPALFARTVSNQVIAMLRGGIMNPKEHWLMPEFVPGQTLG